MSRVLSAEWWKLDADQAAVFNHEGACVVVAGPGSGKTRTVVARAARLIHLNGDRSVVMATFSRAAAAEMRERLTKVLKEPSVRPKLRVSTLHALSLCLLRTRKGKPQPRVLEEQASRDLIRRCALSQGVDERQVEEVIAQVQALRATSLDLSSAKDSASDPVRAVSIEYQTRLAAVKCIDMTDLVREATLALQTGELQIDATQLIIDEAQDIDPIQLEFIAACVKQGAVVTAVADDDQSIYGFRASLGHEALKAVAERAGAAVLHLVNNYRSARDIVEGASYVIEESVQRFHKRIRPVREDAGRVSLRTYLDEGAQAQAIADEAAEFLAANKSATAGVIARTNLELDLCEAALLAQDIAVNRLGGTGLLKREGIRRYLGLLLLADQTDDANRMLSGLELLAVSAAARQKVDEHVHVKSSPEPLLDRLFDTALLDQLGKQDCTLFKGWRDDLVAYVDACASARDDEQRSEALLQQGIRLLAHSPDLRLRQDGAFLTRLLARRRKGSITARILAFEAARSTKETRATVLTAHASKGLEYDAVWVVNCNEGRFPIEGSDPEEERRLFYVAMTRAREVLTLSSLSKEPRSGFVETLRAKALASMNRGEVLDSPAEVEKHLLDQRLHGAGGIQPRLTALETEQTARQ